MKKNSVGIDNFSKIKNKCIQRERIAFLCGMLATALLWLALHLMGV